ALDVCLERRIFRGDAYPQLLGQRGSGEQGQQQAPSCATQHPGGPCTHEVAFSAKQSAARSGDASQGLGVGVEEYMLSHRTEMDFANFLVAVASIERHVAVIPRVQHDAVGSGVLGAPV